MGSQGGPNVIICMSIKGRQESQSERKDWKMLPCWLEDRGRSQEPRKAGSLWKLGKARKQTDCSLEPSERTSLAGILILGFLTSQIVSQ